MSLFLGQVGNSLSAVVFKFGLCLLRGKDAGGYDDQCPLVCSDHRQVVGTGFQLFHSVPGVTSFDIGELEDHLIFRCFDGSLGSEMGIGQSSDFRLKITPCHYFQPFCRSPAKQNAGAADNDQSDDTNDSGDWLPVDQEVCMFERPIFREQNAKPNQSEDQPAAAVELAGEVRISSDFQSKRQGLVPGGCIGEARRDQIHRHKIFAEIPTVSLIPRNGFLRWLVVQRVGDLVGCKVAGGDAFLSEPNEPGK